MGKLPVNPENGAEHIAHDALQHIARGVAALPAPGTKVARKRIAAILARARSCVQFRSHIAPYLPDMEGTEAHRKRMKPAHKRIVPRKGEVYAGGAQCKTSSSGKAKGIETCRLLIKESVRNNLETIKRAAKRFGEHGCVFSYAELDSCVFVCKLTIFSGHLVDKSKEYR